MLYWLAHTLSLIQARLLHANRNKVIGFIIANTFFHRSGISVSWKHESVA